MNEASVFWLTDICKKVRWMIIVQNYGRKPQHLEALKISSRNFDNFVSKYVQNNLESKWTVGKSCAIIMNGLLGQTVLEILYF